jgi:hypothetical protein
LKIVEEEEIKEDKLKGKKEESKHKDYEPAIVLQSDDSITNGVLTHDFRQDSKRKVEEEDYEDDDPLNHYGYGLVSYFNLIKTMIFIFLILSLINIPVMMTYRRYESLSGDVTDRLFKIYSMGNMGFSNTKCIHTNMLLDHLTLKCKTGRIE